MKVVDVEKAPAGVYLDTICAKLVGIEWCWIPAEYGSGLDVYSLKTRKRWSPTTKLSATKELIEVMVEHGYMIRIDIEPNDVYWCEMTFLDWDYKERPKNMTDADELGDTIELAICRAFLSAHGIKEIEIWM